MKRLVVSAIALAIAISAPAAAQTVDPAAEARIRGDITFLADDALEGRKPGERGYELAALYVQTRMQAMGLTPGVDGGWMQPVTFARTGIAEAGATLTWTPAGGSPVVWRNGEGGLISAGSEAGHDAVSAGVVFVGYGIDSPAQGMDDYAGLDVGGKIVVMLAGAPAGLPSEIAAHLGSGKAATAARHGALGVITVNTEASGRRFTGELMRRFANRTQTAWVGADGKPNGAGGGARFGAYLSDESAAALFAGAGKSYADIRAEAAQDGGRPKGFVLDGQAAFDVNTRRDDFQSANVIGVIPGSDPAVRDEMVVMTAHLDHLGISPEGEDRINNGALDNAGGVSIMLEAARSLIASPPRRSVMVVALTAEEMGLLGSDYLARHPVVATDKVIADVNLDMPILTYAFTDVVAFGAEHSTLGPLVDQAARAEDLTLSPDPMPEQGVFTRSDHYSFVKAGVPSVMLATGYANGGEAEWARFFAEGYHQPSDDLSLPFRWDAAAHFARVNAAIARAIADAPERPMWYENNPFGDQFAPDAPKAPAPAAE
ncbi:MAG: M28 family peptidase [Brevundimonas sp.]|uniref:M28 family metallopeptidase n=1 Tax=Brevundimonas sp. TaxID=1871086 RepID=UPI0025C491AC|nr:M28 family metallopeptidase [Brevundimonas sp.]MBX3476350.1 M28 family peptidase [Brevundimonas sp.]